MKIVLQVLGLIIVLNATKVMLFLYKKMQHILLIFKNVYKQILIIVMYTMYKTINVINVKMVINSTCFNNVKSKNLIYVKTILKSSLKEIIMIIYNKPIYFCNWVIIWMVVVNVIVNILQYNGILVLIINSYAESHNTKIRKTY